MQAPTSEVSDEPLSYPIINVEWAGVLIGLCQSMLHRRAWDGSEAEQDAAIQQAEELIYRLMNSDPPATGGTTMAIGTIFPYVNALPANALPCDFSLHNESDYPDLYAVIDSALQVDAAHFRTPPPPTWLTTLTTALAASSVYNSVQTADKVNDGNTATAWRSSAAPPQWCEYSFNYPVQVSSYTLNVGAATIEKPKTWQFQAWLDGAWVTLDTQTNVTLNANTNYTYNIAPAPAYKFRLYVTAVNADVRVYVAEFTLAKVTLEWKYGIVASEPA